MWIEIIWSHNDNTNCTFMHLIINIQITNTSSFCLSLFKLSFFSLILRFVIMVEWNIGHLWSSAKKLLVNTSPRQQKSSSKTKTRKAREMEPKMQPNQNCLETKGQKEKILTGGDFSIASFWVWNALLFTDMQISREWAEVWQSQTLNRS